MGYLIYDSDLELSTKIPKEKLVYTICDFYWTMGHKTIKLGRETEDHINYEEYKPAKKIENIDRITEITVSTYNKKKISMYFLIR